MSMINELKQLADDNKMELEPKEEAPTGILTI